jgi:hypothetical protein
MKVLHISLWYLIMNAVTAVDYLGASSHGNIEVSLPRSVVLSAIASIGGAGQIQK